MIAWSVLFVEPGLLRAKAPDQQLTSLEKPAAVVDLFVPIPKKVPAKQNS